MIASMLLHPLFFADAVRLGCDPARARLTRDVRAFCDETSAVLVLDEVTPDLRITHGGAVQAFGAVPDLVLLGKAIRGDLECLRRRGQELGSSATRRSRIPSGAPPASNRGSTQRSSSHTTSKGKL